MKKETFFIHAESEVARDRIIQDLMECIDFAATAGELHMVILANALSCSPWQWQLYDFTHRTRWPLSFVVLGYPLWRGPVPAFPATEPILRRIISQRQPTARSPARSATYNARQRPCFADASALARTWRGDSLESSSRSFATADDS